MAKLTDVHAPIGLINATSFFLIWAYPKLAVSPQNGEVAGIQEVQVTYRAVGESIGDTIITSFPSINVTIDRLQSGTLYLVAVQVVYNRPNLIGENVELNITTIPGSKSDFHLYIICMYI